MAESERLLGQPPRRGAARVIARAFGALTIATVAAFVAGGSSARPPPMRSLSSSSAAPPTDAAPPRDTYTIDLTSLTEVSHVVSEMEAARSYWQLLPRSISLAVERELLRGDDDDLGAQMEWGHVAFVLSAGDFGTGAIDASYVVVLSMKGDVVAVRPGERYWSASARGAEAGQPAVASEPFMSHFLALKSFNATALLLLRAPLTDGLYATERCSANCTSLGARRQAIVWDWRSGREEVLFALDDVRRPPTPDPPHSPRSARGRPAATAAR